MNILVCIKQTPAVMKIALDPETNKMIREGVPNITNPADRNALELALTLRGDGGSVTAISMGPESAEEVLREAIAQGADKALLISDAAFAGADTYATAVTLAAAANKLGSFDLVICGDYSVDGGTGQVAAKLSQLLNMSLATRVKEAALNGETLSLTRVHELGEIKMEAALPAVLSVAKDSNKPRTPGVKSKMAAKKAVIERLGAADLGLSPDEVGQNGSKTVIERSFEPPFKAKGVMIEESSGAEGAKKLMSLLVEAGLV